MPQQAFAFEDLKRILVEEGGLVESDVYNDRQARFDQMGLDSLGFIQIQTAMEQEYGIAVPEEDADRITTVGDALDYVNGRLEDQQQ